MHFGAQDFKSVIFAVLSNTETARRTKDQYESFIKRAIQRANVLDGKLILNLRRPKQLSLADESGRGGGRGGYRGRGRSDTQKSVGTIFSTNTATEVSQYDGDGLELDFGKLLPVSQISMTAELVQQQGAWGGWVPPPTPPLARQQFKVDESMAQYCRDALLSPDAAFELMETRQLPLCINNETRDVMLRKEEERMRKEENGGCFLDDMPMNAKRVYIKMVSPFYAPPGYHKFCSSADVLDDSMKVDFKIHMSEKSSNGYRGFDDWRGEHKSELGSNLRMCFTSGRFSSPSSPEYEWYTLCMEWNQGTKHTLSPVMHEKLWLPSLMGNVALAEHILEMYKDILADISIIPDINDITKDEFYPLDLLMGTSSYLGMEEFPVEMVQVRIIRSECKAGVDVSNETDLSEEVGYEYFADHLNIEEQVANNFGRRKRSLEEFLATLDPSERERAIALQPTVKKAAPQQTICECCTMLIPSFGIWNGDTRCGSLTCAAALP